MPSSYEHLARCAWLNPIRRKHKSHQPTCVKQSGQNHRPPLDVQIDCQTPTQCPYFPAGSKEIRMEPKRLYPTNGCPKLQSLQMWYRQNECSSANMMKLEPNMRLHDVSGANVEFSSIISIRTWSPQPKRSAPHTESHFSKHLQQNKNVKFVLVSVSHVLDLLECVWHVPWQLL